MDLKQFKKLPLMGIIRGVDPSKLEPLIEVSARAGLQTLEITMNTPGAADLIKKACGLSGGRVSVGAGTVLSMDEMDSALRAGAEFIVMPVYIKEITDACKTKGISVFPGAFTPQEVFEAWKGGASMVKVFPSGALGPEYIKALKGPFNDIKLMAVGGVKLDNIKDYFACGADAVAFGAGVFKKEWLDSGDFNAIGSLVAQYVAEVKKQVEQ